MKISYLLGIYREPEATVPNRRQITPMGFTLIKQRRGQSGTFARTSAQIEACGMTGAALSVMNWIDPDFDEALRAGKLTEDLCGALETAFGHVPEGGELQFPPGVFPIAATVRGGMLAKARLFGPGVIKALDGKDFEFLLDLSGTVGVTVERLIFDANKTGRASAMGKLSGVIASSTTLVEFNGCTFKNTAGLASGDGASAVALVISGKAAHPKVFNCRFLDLGHSATVKPSDALFMRADHGLVMGVYGSNVTDHLVALEGCNNTQAIALTAKNCTSLAGMSNDTDTGCGGNIIRQVAGTCNYFGSFGGPIGAYTFGAGTLRGRISDVTIRAAPGAGGGGGAVYLKGNLAGLELENIKVDGRASSSMQHGLVGDAIHGRVNVVGFNSKLRGGASAGARLINGSAGIVFDNARFESGNYGYFASEGSSFVERNTVFIGQASEKIGLEGGASWNGKRHVARS